MKKRKGKEWKNDKNGYIRGGRDEKRVNREGEKREGHRGEQGQKCKSLA